MEKLGFIYYVTVSRSVIVIFNSIKRVYWSAQEHLALIVKLRHNVITTG